MVLLIGFALLVCLVILFYRVTDAPKESAAGTASAAGSANLSGIGVAYLSNGKLFYQPDGGALRQLHSPYIQEIEDRLARSNERNAWKKNTSFEVAAYGQMKQFGEDANAIRYTSAQFDEKQSILYFLSDAGIGGLFSFDLETGVETRIVHRQNLDLSDLNLNRETGKLVCTSSSKDSITNIATLDVQGNNLRELTGGDTADSAPAWCDEDSIVYQSAGLARNKEGMIVALGHSTIQKLDLRSGKLDTVLDDPNTDFLHPRVTRTGELLFIRRPYDVPQYSSGNILLDTVLFPFRLLRAVFHYLNFFSMMYSRKPLTGASGPATQADVKAIILKGKRIDAEKALRSESMVAGVPSLVPASWQLVQRSRQGDDRVLASNVASYDITPAGQILYSNGRGVFLLGEDGRSTLVLKGDLVGDIIAR
ncbi:hypothetical protein [Massilia pseudoviolaceinigra]|uniref:hypothetical protein n=1 Tax=Massilia pseudoviolaceinigra TaxID=3057165 RepID=UPI002796BBAD|nr:hypothetical protein [Massilia sp. CCM 9206]MDQ1919092.1 hypothetical protein [Massilia sp. CCM 9206]